MFVGATAFNQPVGSWNVSSTTQMNGVFKNASAFNQPIGNWNTSNVTSMNEMFSGASAFNQNISSWCVGNISSQPANFKANAPLSNNNTPNWGTCPPTPGQIVFYSGTCRCPGVAVGQTATISGTTYTLSLIHI